MIFPDIKIFEFWNFLFKIYSFAEIADEAILERYDEEVLVVVVQGSVLLVDPLQNRNEFSKGEVAVMKKERSYTIRATSDNSVVILINQNGN